MSVFELFSLEGRTAVVTLPDNTGLLW